MEPNRITDAMVSAAAAASVNHYDREERKTRDEPEPVRKRGTPRHAASYRGAKRNAERAAGQLGGWWSTRRRRRISKTLGDLHNAYLRLVDGTATGDDRNRYGFDTSRP